MSNERGSGFSIVRDVHFMSAYPKAMTGFRCEQLLRNVGRWMALTSCAVHDHAHDWEPSGHGGEQGE